MHPLHISILFALLHCSILSASQPRTTKAQPAPQKIKFVQPKHTTPQISTNISTKKNTPPVSGHPKPFCKRSDVVHSLEEALCAVYTYSEELALAQKNVFIATNNINKAVAGGRMNISINGNTSFSKTKQIKKLPEESAQISSVSRDIKVTGDIALQQSIYEGGRIRADVEAARHEYAGAITELIETEQKVLRKGIEDFLNIIGAQKKLDIKQKNLKNSNDLVLQAEKKVASGEINPGDLLRAQSNAIQARNEYATAQEELHIARLTFQTKYGNVALAPSLIMDDRKKIILPSQEEMIRRIHMHPIMCGLQEKIRAAYQRVKSARGAFLPRLSLKGDVSQSYINSKNDDSTTSGTSRDLTGRIGLDLSIPLITGGATSANYRNNVQELQKAHLVAANKKSDLVTEIGASYRRFDVAKKNLERTTKMVLLNDKMYEMAKKRFLAGDITVNDLLDMENQQEESQKILIQYKMDMWRSYYDLQALQGKLRAACLRLNVNYDMYDTASYHQTYAQSWFSMGERIDEQAVNGHSDKK